MSGGLSLHSIQQYLGYFALVAVAAACWVFLYLSEQAMVSMRGDGLIMEMMWAMMEPTAIARYLLASVVMWVVMMLAMMIPAALPMAMVFRGLSQDSAALFSTVSFALGYLLVWIAFALVGAGLQWGLHSNGDLRGHLLTASPITAGVILLAAGLYQLTPFKQACLARCRSPMGFFLEHWRDGHLGALVMGLRHGFYCLGCCWMLMLLMFVGGAMSVTTMALLCVLIIGERLLPTGPVISRVPAIALLIWGGTLLAGVS